MRLTTKGRFAVTAMIDLALRQTHGPVTLSGISQRQNISLSYLEQLFGKLRRFNIVESTRGPGGGYKLARPGDEITVADIIVAVDEPLDATQCGGKGHCHGQDAQHSQCMTHDLWSNLNAKMVEYLESVTLHNLVMQQESRGIALIEPIISSSKAKMMSSLSGGAIGIKTAASSKKAQADLSEIKRTGSKKIEPKRILINSVFNLAQQS